MEVICLGTDAFYSLLQEVIKFTKAENKDQPDKWIITEEAMKLSGVKSKTTLQKMRNEGSIRFSQQEKKITLYDRDPIT